jgi:hypothetical protein
MIAPESDHSDTPSGQRQRPDRDDRPVTAHRGGTVNVDSRRAKQVVVGIGLTAMAVIGVVLLIAGIQNNSQINSLRHNGVPVTVTVDRCLGLMGGTGQNSVGYSCTGTYTLGGTPYRQAIPGIAFHAPGSAVQGIAVPDDPKLLTTPDQLARQHASWSAFIIPGLLLLFVAVALVFLIVGRRAEPAAAAPDGNVDTEPR